MLPFEPADLKSLQGRHNYPQLTSNEVMQEMQSFKVQAKIAQDSHARAIGIQQGASLDLKAKVVEHNEDQDCEDVSSMDAEELKVAHRDYVALVARTFWKNPSKAKAQVERKFESNGFKEGNPKMKTYFNCQDRYHFMVDCPYENREDHGGMLIRKDASKSPSKKPFFKKNLPNKKPPSRMVLVKNRGVHVRG